MNRCYILSNIITLNIITLLFCSLKYDFTSCFTGTPKPEISLRKDGDEVDKSRYEIIEEEEICTIIVKKITSKDSGKFKLVAKNLEGETTQDVKVKVQPK